MNLTHNNTIALFQSPHPMSIATFQKDAVIAITAAKAFTEAVRRMLTYRGTLTINQQSHVAQFELAAGCLSLLRTPTCITEPMTQKTPESSGTTTPNGTATSDVRPDIAPGSWTPWSSSPIELPKFSKVKIHSPFDSRPPSSDGPRPLFGQGSSCNQDARPPIHPGSASPIEALPVVTVVDASPRSGSASPRSPRYGDKAKRSSNDKEASLRYNVPTRIQPRRTPTPPLPATITKPAIAPAEARTSPREEGGVAPLTLPLPPNVLFRTHPTLPNTYLMGPNYRLIVKVTPTGLVCTGVESAWANATFQRDDHEFLKTHNIIRSFERSIPLREAGSLPQSDLVLQSGN